MMEKKEIEKRILNADFLNNNGKVMRTVNILGFKYSKVQSIEFALQGQGVNRWEFMESLDYLFDEGYLHLRTIDDHVPVVLADCDDYHSLEVKVTSKGTRLLRGAIIDSLVKV